MIRRIVIGCIIALAVSMSLPASAQWTYRKGLFSDSTLLKRQTFRSTSIMPVYETSYASRPKIQSDGTAAMTFFVANPSITTTTVNGTQLAIAGANSTGNNRGGGGVPIIGPDPEDDFLPLGDAVWPLLCFAFAYIYVVKRRKQHILSIKMRRNLHKCIICCNFARFWVQKR